MTIRTLTDLSVSGALTVSGISSLGARRLISGSFNNTTGAGDTVQFLNLTSTNFAMNVEIEVSAVVGTTVITKSYEITLALGIGLGDTWYGLIPIDSSQNFATGTNYDFQIEINRNTITSQMNFRFHNQNAAGMVSSLVAPVITYTASVVTEASGFAYTQPNTSATAVAAITAMHPTNALFAGPTQVGIGTQSPAYALDVVGSVNASDFLVATKSISRGVATLWRASGAAAGTAGTSETAFYSGVASTTIVSGRRYRVIARVTVAPSAATATNAARLFVRLGSGLAGAQLAASYMPQQSTGNMTQIAVGTFLGGTDVTAGTQTFTISGQSATGTLTVQYTVGSNFLNPEMSIEDIGI